MRTSISQSNILPACALVFLFYLAFVLVLNALLPQHAALAAVVFLLGLFAEYRLFSAMLSHVYDKHFTFFRNALALFVCACCAFFMLRGSIMGFPLGYTLFAAVPLTIGSLRQKRRNRAE